MSTTEYSGHMHSVLKGHQPSPSLPAGKTPWGVLKYLDRHIKYSESKEILVLVLLRSWRNSIANIPCWKIMTEDEVRVP